MDLVIVQLIEYAIWGAIVVALGILALVAAGAVHEGRAQPPLRWQGAPPRGGEAPGWPDAVLWADEDDSDADSSPRERGQRAA